MKIISFAWTTLALLAGRKTCTCRNWNAEYAKRFKVGDLVQAYDKNPRNGGKCVAVIELTEVYERPMNWAPPSDYEAEGLQWMEEQNMMVPVTDVKSKVKLPMHPLRFWEAWTEQDYKMWVVRFKVLERYI